MTLRRDLRSGLRGAARLLIGAPVAPDTLPPEAARHSFVAVLLCLPVAAVTRWVLWRNQGPPFHPWHAIAVDLALFAIGWAGFLELARAALGFAGEARAWPRLVTVWNWCNVAQYAVLLAADLFDLFRAGAFVLSVIGLVSLFWQSWIEWRALCPVVGNPWGAAGLVALDFLLGVAVQSATLALGG